MRTIWIGAWSVPMALLMWWVSTEVRRDAVETEAPQAVQTSAPPGPGLTNEFDGAPGDLSSIRTDLVATPSRLQLRAVIGRNQPTAELVVVASQNVAVLQARPTTGALERQPTITRIDGREFRVQVRVADGLAEGNYRGYLELKTCLDEDCLSAIPRGTLYVAYEVKVDDPKKFVLGEWETFQRDAGHTGYVPATFRPSAFTYKWQWLRPTSGVIGSIAGIAELAKEALNKQQVAAPSRPPRVPGA